MVYRISPFQKENKEVEPTAPAPVAANDVNTRLSALE
jgi:hypothetical protein